MVKIISIVFLALIVLSIGANATNNFIVYNNFTAGSINSTFWNASIANTATLLQQNNRIEVLEDSGDDGAYISTKENYDTYVANVTINHSAISSGYAGAYVWSQNATPHFVSTFTGQSGIKISVAVNQATGKITISYVDRNRQIQNWNGTSGAWQTGAYGISAAVTTKYNYSIEKNYTHYRVTVLDNTGNNLNQTTWLSCLDVIDGCYDDYIAYGDIFTGASNLDFMLFNFSISWNNSQWKKYPYEDTLIFPTDEGRHPSDGWLSSWYNVTTASGNKYWIITVYGESGNRKSFGIYSLTSNKFIQYNTTSTGTLSGSTTGLGLVYIDNINSSYWNGTGDFNYYQFTKNETTSYAINSTAVRPPLIHNGSRRSGILIGTAENIYFELPNVSVLNGTLCIKNTCEAIVSGKGWFDHTWGPGGTGIDGSEYLIGHFPGKELFLWNIFSGIKNDDTAISPIYSIEYQNTSNLANYTSNTSMTGFNFEAVSFSYRPQSGQIRANGWNLTIPNESVSLTIRSYNMTEWDLDTPYRYFGTWGAETVTGSLIIEPAHAYNAIRRHNFSISSLNAVTARIPVNHTKDNNTKLLNGSGAWLNQIYFDRSNITLYGVLSGTQNISELNVSVITNVSYVNVTIELYNSSDINFTVTGSAVDQSINITIYNSTFPIITSSVYRVSRNGTMFQEVTATSDQIAFYDVPVGGTYNISLISPIVYPALSGVTVSKNHIFKCQQSLVTATFTNYTHILTVLLLLTNANTGITEQNTMTDTGNGIYTYVYGGSSSLSFGNKTISISSLDAITGWNTEYPTPNRYILVYSDICTGVMSDASNVSLGIGNYTNRLNYDHVDLMSWFFLPYVEYWGYAFYFIMLFVFVSAEYLKGQEISKPLLLAFIGLTSLAGSSLLPEDYGLMVKLLLATAITAIVWKVAKS